MSDNNDIALSDVLNALRSELTALNKAASASTETATFEINDIEVELLAKVTQQDKAKGSAGVKFWVVNSSLSAERTDGVEHYQKIKLNLTPIPPKGSKGETMRVNKSDGQRRFK